MSTYWNDKNSPMNPISAPDFIPMEQMRELQLYRLQGVVKHCYDNVELFRTRLDEKGLKPEDIKVLDDIAKLPFSVKTDLRNHYPYGLFASSLKDIVRLHASSGTTGKPIVVGYTDEDMKVWTNVMVRSLAACGVSSEDIVQNAYGYGLFTGGLGVHCGAEALGATVIPISGGNTSKQIMLLKDFCSTVITVTPSYFLHVIEVASEMGISIKDLPLRVGIFGAEPWTFEMRERIEKEAGIKAYDIYGLSEIIGPGVGVECSAQNGLHIFEDHFYPEIIDPDTGEVLPDGSEGELVLTTLTKQAIPMIRYRTRDITTIMTEKCDCGRTIRRIKKISTRSDDMLIIRGVNVFPSQIEAALLAVEGTLPHYMIYLTTEHDMDAVEVKVEINSAQFGDTVSAIEKLKAAITNSIKSIVGVSVKVTLVEPKTIERSQGKAKRVIDQRNK
ncbi:MAG: phenylacetate--CoA ligase [Kiritimatiellae bacterium]|jgi:phenylacetate-CoA ligase|nr:phenylacetate--CoA ligase [Kiritimatiellia bacterium]